ncbi:MAG: esterase [Aquificae bacterium]|nr:esterase [Aquificota bacterium]
MKVIYIHGFNSAGYGDKVNRLKEQFGMENVLSVNLPYKPEKAVSQLQFLIRNIKNEEPLLLVGTSLGGAYAMYLAYRFDLPAVVINPSVKPSQDLKDQIGKQVNYKTGEEYHFSQEDVKWLENIELPITELEKIKDKLFIYLDEGDELLDSRATAEYFKGFYVKMFPGGDHRFQHMDQLLEDLKRKSVVRY